MMMLTTSEHFVHEQCDNVTIYSILFENEGDNEFMKFIHKYANNPPYVKNVQRIVYYLEKIKENGVLERYFRPEGKRGQNIKAIPIEVNKLRLYAIRLTIKHNELAGDLSFYYKK